MFFGDIKFNYLFKVYHHVSEDLDSTRLTPSEVQEQRTSKQIKKPKIHRPSNKIHNFREKVSVDSDSSLEKSPKKTARGRIIKKTNYFTGNSDSFSEDKYDSDDSFLVMTSESDESPRRSSKKTSRNKNDIVYLDLTKDEVEEVSIDSCESPAANRSEQAYNRNIILKLTLIFF